jgi:hypothetical protein
LTTLDRTKRKEGREMKEGKEGTYKGRKGGREKGRK